MKRQILSIATVLALTAAGAVFAQSPQNTTAPGPTQQREPGQTNNNLPNPGNPQTDLQRNQGTVQGTAAESTTQDQNTGTTGSTTGTTTGTMGTGNTTAPMVHPETETGTGVDVDVDTGNKAEGAVDVDVTRTTDSDTDASGSGVQTTGQYNNSDTDSLPSTASELPTVALLGLLALGAAFAMFVKRNA